MTPGQSDPGHSDRYWEAIGKEWGRDQPQLTWRAHSDAVNRRLLAAWLHPVPQGRLLKTDSFDEAVSEGVADMLLARCRHFTGMDVAPETLRRAAKRLEHGSLAAADVRWLPFRAASFDTVVSLSTLDHFPTHGELSASLRELRRVSAPGATLILTLDNPSNPLLWLRGALSFRVLERVGLVPYYVGVTLAPAALRRAVEEAGFAIEETRAILHVPRVLAIALGRWLGRWTDGRGRARWLRWLMGFEWLERLPTRMRTGHFVAVRARVPEDPEGALGVRLPTRRRPSCARPTGHRDPDAWLRSAAVGGVCAAARSGSRSAARRSPSRRTPETRSSKCSSRSPAP